MTHNDSHSVATLRRESERTRAELSQTVEALKDQIADTAEDIRHKVSPQHIKAEVSNYVTQKGRHWLDNLKQQALDNPMQALAVGSAIAVPAFKMVRSIPLPLLMIGAGLALASPKVRDAAMSSTGLTPADGRDAMRDVADRARGAWDDATAQAGYKMEEARGVVTDAAQDAKETASRIADDVRKRVTDVGQAARETLGSAQESLRSTIDSASERAKDALDTVRTKASETITSARDTAESTIRDNSLLVGGLGIAIGALIAASLPSTRIEGQTLGSASDAVRRRAAEAASETFDEVKEAAMSAADEVTDKVAEAAAGASKKVGRTTEKAAENIKTVADDAITTAFEPSQTDHR